MAAVLLYCHKQCLLPWRFRQTLHWRHVGYRVRLWCTVLEQDVFLQQRCLAETFAFGKAIACSSVNIAFCISRRFNWNSVYSATKKTVYCAFVAASSFCLQIRWLLNLQGQMYTARYLQQLTSVELTDLNMTFRQGWSDTDSSKLNVYYVWGKQLPYI